MDERILLVEDDHALGTQVVKHLRAHDFDVDWVQDGDTALGRDPAQYGLIVLDLMLPGTYGMDVLKHMRELCEAPIVILSARVEALDKVRALKLGADDYVTKPFWPEELIARIHARLRRPALVASDQMRVGKLVLDVERRAVSLAGATVELTGVEFDLLAALMRRRGMPLTRTWLADNVLERGSGERTLDVHVSRLRRKLGDYGAMIRTVWRTGYKLDEGATP